MATKNFVNYNANAAGRIATGYVAKPRTLEVFIDFTLAGNQVAAAADSLQLFNLPKGTMVLGGGQEQITAGSAGSTTQLRVGTLALTATLASDAAVGTMPAVAGSATDDTPTVLTAAADVNLLVGTAVRATGKVRAWVVVQEGFRPTGEPKVAARDTSTGLA